jgi:hypothetical protein
MFYVLLAEAKQTFSPVKNFHGCLNKSSDSKQVPYSSSLLFLQEYVSIGIFSSNSRLFFFKESLFSSLWALWISLLARSVGEHEAAFFHNRGNLTVCGRMSAAYWYEIMERTVTGMHMALTKARHIEWYNRPQEPECLDNFTVNNRDLNTAIGTANYYPINMILGIVFASKGQ